jgi:hypothetical protein
VISVYPTPNYCNSMIVSRLIGTFPVHPSRAPGPQTAAWCLRVSSCKTLVLRADIDSLLRYVAHNKTKVNLVRSLPFLRDKPRRRLMRTRSNVLMRALRDI